VATIDGTDRRIRNRRVLFALGLMATLGLAIVVWAFQPPTQIGPDDDVFATVDALFTAVNGKSDLRLNDCERRLHAYRDSGKLPTAAAGALDGIILQARSGAWEGAGKRLYDFMRGQRRAGRNDRQRPGRTRQTANH
jgi:hypothetical protein